MADIRCPRCGEPWDTDSLHEEIDYRAELGQMCKPDSPRQFHGPAYDRYRMAYDALYSQVRAEFAARGCHALTFADYRCERIDSTAARYASALFDLMGDDLDGVAAELDDMSALGFLD